MRCGNLSPPFCFTSAILKIRSAEAHLRCMNILLCTRSAIPRTHPPASRARSETCFQTHKEGERWRQAVRNRLTVSLTQLNGVQAQVLDHPLARTQRAADAVRQSWDLHVEHRRLLAAALNVVEARKPLRSQRRGKERGRRIAAHSLGARTHARTHGSPPSPGWCGQRRVRGIVTGAESTRRQFGFEALRPLQRRVRMQELGFIYSAHASSASEPQVCVRMCVQQLGRIRAEMVQTQRRSPAAEVCPPSGVSHPRQRRRCEGGGAPRNERGVGGGQNGRAPAAFPF